MKPILILFLGLLVIGTVHAAPVIGSSTAVPSELWLGDPLNITASCSDSENNISSVYTDIGGPGILLPGLQLAQVDNTTYFISVPGNYFDRKGSYTATIFCASNGTKVNATAGFVISELAGVITSVTNPVYVGDVIEVNFLPKKNGNIIISDVSFSVSLDSQQKQLRMPAVYDTNRGWILRIDLPNVPRMYTLGVSALYQNKIIYSSNVIEIKPGLEFDITSLEKSSFVSNENVTVSIKSKLRGSLLTLNTSNLAIKINSQTATIQSITPSGDGFAVKFTTPSISPGHYQISAELSYNDTSYVSSEPVDYVTLISGKFTDPSGRGLNAQFRFSKSGSEKLRISTLSDGTYSAQMIPDVYDVDIDLSDAHIHLVNANVNTFTNAFTYSYSSGSAVKGLVTSGIYTIGTAWTFDVASVSLKYDKNKYDDETLLKVFKCSNWNNIDSSCNSAWVVITPSISSSQSLVTFTTAGFSTFGVGVQEKINLNLAFDKTDYGLRDVIKIRGSTAGKNQIGNVNTTIKIINSQIETTAVSDANGVFSIDMIGPESEGRYTVSAKSVKYPYLSDEKTYTINVKPVPDISIGLPSSIQVEQGKNTTLDLVITNIGQAPLTNLKISTDLDEKYYHIGEIQPIISVKEEVHIPLDFFAGINETPTTISGTIKFESDQITKEMIFGFTVLEKPVIPESTPLTGFSISLPVIDTNMIYVVIITVLVVFAAIIIKKINTRKKNSAPIISVQKPNQKAFNTGFHRYYHSDYTGISNSNVRDRNLVESAQRKSNATAVNRFSARVGNNIRTPGRFIAGAGADSAYLSEIKSYLASKKEVKTDV